MKRLLRLLVLLAIAIMSWPVMSAESVGASQDNIEEELRTPVVGNKQRAYVKSYMKTIAESLYRDGYKVETMRNGEVVIAVVQTDDIFLPNDSAFMKGSSAKLDKFRQFFQPGNLYKVVVAVHSDNTGTEEYLTELTRSRIYALMDYYERQGCDIDNFVGFPMGDTVPLNDNESRENRAINRRIEFYIVPGDDLLQQARLNKK